MPEVSEFPWCVTRMFCSFENSPPSLPRTQTRSSCLGMGHLTSVLPGGAHAREKGHPWAGPLPQLSLIPRLDVPKS